MSAEAAPAGPGPEVADTGVTRVRKGVVAVAFLAVLVSGFDEPTLAILVPTLASQWATPASNFTAPLVLTNVGAVFGFLMAGAIGARLGRRRLMLLAVAVFATALLVTALTLGGRSIPLLSVLRLITGVGLGLLLPAAVALATDHSPARRREIVAIVVTLGLALGASVSGLSGPALIESIGPAGIFWASTVLSALLIPAILAVIPESAPEPVPESAERPSAPTAKAAAHTSNLFAGGLRLSTLMLWAFAFLVFTTHNTLGAWVPTLLIDYGFSPAEAPLGAAFFNLGGLVGGVALIGLTAAIGAARSIVVLVAVGLVALLAAGALDHGGGVLLAIGVAGAGIGAALIGQLTLAVSLYPPATRTTGVGWAAAMGRTGSVIGPAAAGALLAIAVPAQSLLLLTAVPVAVALTAAVGLARRLHTTRRGHA